MTTLTKIAKLKAKVTSQEAFFLNIICGMRNQYIGNSGHMFMSTGEDTERVLQWYFDIPDNYRGYFPTITIEDLDIAPRLTQTL